MSFFTADTGSNARSTPLGLALEAELQWPYSPYLLLGRSFKAVLGVPILF